MMTIGKNTRRLVAYVKSDTDEAILAQVTKSKSKSKIAGAILDAVFSEEYKIAQRKLMDDLLIGGTCAYKTTEKGIEYVDLYSPEAQRAQFPTAE